MEIPENIMPVQSSFDNDTQTATIDALSQIVFLNEKTPIVWSDLSGSRMLPIAYTKGQGGDVTLRLPVQTMQPPQISPIC